MAPVEVVHWNPQRPIFSGRVGRRIPLRRPLNNFGDLLGPVIVAELVRRRGLASGAHASRRLLAVGSILKLARDGDTIWGIGANGKSLNDTFDFQRLDVRAVRGPLTRAFLEERGIAAPAVFGDPGLLVGELWTREELRGGAERRSLTVIPNLNDLPSYDPAQSGLVVPTDPLWSVLARIAASDLVVGSSLHAIVVAESLGLPARLIESGAEPSFKYEDYYRGSGRDGYRPATSVEEAVALGGEPTPEWDSQALLAAFPNDLWDSID